MVVAHGKVTTYGDITIQHMQRDASSIKVSAIIHHARVTTYAAITIQHTVRGGLTNAATALSSKGPRQQHGGMSQSKTTMGPSPYHMWTRYTNMLSLC